MKLGITTLSMVLVIWNGLVQDLKAQSFDILIKNGTVLDGTGNPGILVDIGISDGKITAVGLLPDASAVEVIDARGMHVVPGFIDMHSHADRSLYQGNVLDRQASNLVAQGITTIVVGPDGRNPVWPISEEVRGYSDGGTAVNVVPMVGHATVRREIMGDDYEREATGAEIEEMKNLVRLGMDEGGWGLGAGPEYRPGRFASTEEIIELAKVVSEYDGFYYAHQRSQSPLPLWLTPSIVSDYTPPSTWPEGWRLTATDGMHETIRIGREAGIRVMGTHIKAKGPATWGQSAVDVMAIDRARAEGVQVYLDQYPYETFGGGSVEVIPKWYYAPVGTDRSGGLDDPFWNTSGLMDNHLVNLQAHLDDPVLLREFLEDTRYILDLQGGTDRHVIVISPRDESLVGRTLGEVARSRGNSPTDQLIEFALTLGTPLLRSGVRFRGLAGSAQDVEHYMKQDYTATSTDAGIVRDPKPGRHPRYFGSYPHKIATYVRDKGTITLPFFVRSSTGLPAQIVGLEDRGYIRAGQAADIVIFDYEAVQDSATILDPGGGNEGIEFVMVNGEFVVRYGLMTGKLPGIPLLKGN